MATAVACLVALLAQSPRPALAIVRQCESWGRKRARWARIADLWQLPCRWTPVRNVPGCDGNWGCRTHSREGCAAFSCLEACEASPFCAWKRGAGCQALETAAPTMMPTKAPTQAPTVPTQAPTFATCPLVPISTAKPTPFAGADNYLRCMRNTAFSSGPVTTGVARIPGGVETGLGIKAALYTNNANVPHKFLASFEGTIDGDLVLAGGGTTTIPAGGHFFCWVQANGCVCDEVIPTFDTNCMRITSGSRVAGCDVADFAGWTWPPFLFGSGGACPSTFVTANNLCFEAVYKDCSLG